MSRAFWLFGARFIVHANHQDTAGHYDIVEGCGPPGFQTPLHRHSRYWEQFYVLEGEFTIWAGDRAAVLHPGETAIINPGTAHAVAITGANPGLALAIASPSGFARLIMGVGTPDTGGAPQGGRPDMELYERIQAEIGDEMLGPPGSRPA
jgi:quercetin dioxygenase-like cupin family protein